MSESLAVEIVSLSKIRFQLTIDSQPYLEFSLPTNFFSSSEMNGESQEQDSISYKLEGGREVFRLVFQPSRCCLRLSSYFPCHPFRLLMSSALGRHLQTFLDFFQLRSSHESPVGHWYVARTAVSITPLHSCINKRQDYGRLLYITPTGVWSQPFKIMWDLSQDRSNLFHRLPIEILAKIDSHTE
jgi:hypothetical protein